MWALRADTAWKGELLEFFSRLSPLPKEEQSKLFKVKGGKFVEPKGS